MVPFQFTKLSANLHLSLGHKYPYERRTNDFLPFTQRSKIVRTAFARVFVTKAYMRFPIEFHGHRCICVFFSVFSMFFFFFCFFSILFHLNFQALLSQLILIL